MESRGKNRDRRAVVPTRPAAPWQGGKKNLAKTIVPIIDGERHTTYAEPFAGMGGIFLRRKCRPKAEVINDYSQDVANFFRILQRHYVAFLEMLRFQVTTRAGFERLVDTKPATLTDLERAARFLYLQRLSFGGKVRGQNFGVDPGRPARFDVTRLGPQLEALHERLAGVVIERLDFGEFITRYDRKATFFYLDPPYWGCEDDYGRDMFQPEDFARLAEQLGKIKGRFLMSINDVPEIRETFSMFGLTSVRTRYSISGRKSKPVGELLAANFELPTDRKT